MDSQPEGLSAREREIAQAYAGGASYRQIANRLFIAPTTVRTHLGTIYRKLGVSTKIQLLRALEGGSPEAESAKAAAAPATAVGKRQVTVLYAMLDDLLGLAGHADAELVASIEETFHGVVTAAVAHHRGQLLGSGGAAELAACFGLPVSDETDPERAVTCALEISGQLRRRPGRNASPISARIGLCTGSVVAAGDTATRLWGGAPVLAAALARDAYGGGIVVCARTRAALGNLFVFEDLGLSAIDPGADAVRRFAVVAARPSDTRFEALHGYRMTPLVGRDHEVGLLESLFKSARTGEGQVALVSGEPGIGKSRIVRALCDRLALLPEQMLVFQCSPHERTSPLHPVAQNIRQAAGVDLHDNPSARLDALVALFGELIEDDARDRQVLAELASIRYEPPEAFEVLPPEKLRRATLDLLERFVVKRAASGPILLVFEDMHWSDPSTASWLERIVPIVETLPILVIVTFRPEFEWSAGPASNVTTLALPRLGRDQVAEMVRDQAGPVLPLPLVERIVERSEGIPLFVEELTWSILDFHEAGDAVPSTLQASLMGRLDRLGPVREVAQAAAVLGRDFDRDLLAETLPCGPHALGNALNALLTSKLVIRRSAGTPGAMQFKHALIRDAAYDSLLSAQRETFHARVAAALITRSDAGADISPELIAHHLVKGGAPARSVPFWARAGEKATRKSANREAVTHIMSGLAALDALPDDEVRGKCELEFQLALGTPLIAVSGYSGEATVKAYARARELAERLADPDGLFQALYGVWVNSMIRGRHRQAQSIAEQLVSLALRSESTAQEVTARRVLGWSLSLLGELEEGQRQLESALHLFRRDEHGGLFLRFGQDPRIAAISVLAWIACLQGNWKESSRLAAQVISDANDLGHSFTTAYATYIAGAAPSFLMGDFREAHRHLDALMDLATEGDFPFWRGFGLGLRAALLAREGRTVESQALASEAFAALDTISVCWFRPFIFYSLAESYVHAGEPLSASRCVELGLSLIEQTDERWIDPHFRRLQSELAPLLSQGSRQLRP